jgi:hypothetical protein
LLRRPLIAPEQDHTDRGGEARSPKVVLAAVIPVEIEFEVGERVELLTDSSHAVDPALKLATGVPGIRPLQKFGP